MSRLSGMLRDYLSERPDGVRQTQIIFDINARPENVRFALRDTFGVYIARWEWSAARDEYIPVYKIVEVPEDAPKPTDADRVFLHSFNAACDAAGHPNRAGADQR